MALTDEQIKALKSQLSEQIQHLPNDQKVEALKQIESMSSGALESMLKQQQAQTSQPIFRMILEGQIPSVQINQNQHAIAVLSIRSISEGHTIIIPKEKIPIDKEISPEINKFAELISKKLIENLNAKSIRKDIQTLFGEKTISLIPIYNKELSPESPTTEKTPEELETVMKKLNVIKLTKKPKIIKSPPKKKRKKVIKLKRKIP